jgi:hypothetical protein
MSEETRVHEVTVPAGTYFVGDPGYGCPDDDWQAWIGSWTSSSGPDDGIVIIGGHQVVKFRLISDGWYHDQLGHKYKVDAAMLGLVPQALYEQLPEPELSEMYRAGRIVTFGQPVTAWRDDSEYGTLHLGAYEFSTGEMLELLAGDLAELAGLTLRHAGTAPAAVAAATSLRIARSAHFQRARLLGRRYDRRHAGAT